MQILEYSALLHLTLYYIKYKLRAKPGDEKKHQGKPIIRKEKKGNETKA